MEIQFLSSSVARRISFVISPLLGSLLVAWAYWVGVGPGLELLCLLGAFMLIVLAPIVQLFLLTTRIYEGRYLKASLTVISASIGILVIAALTGLFNFW